MRKRTLKEIMEMSKHQDAQSIAKIMADLYEVPVKQLDKPDYRASSGQPKNILADLKIPGFCDSVLNLGEIAYLIKTYRENKVESICSDTALLRIAQLGYWY